MKKQPMNHTFWFLDVTDVGDGTESGSPHLAKINLQA
jgi:hypothetical protein